MKGFIFMINYFRFIKLSIIFIQSFFRFVFNSFFFKWPKKSFFKLFSFIKSTIYSKNLN